jgi:hypothetical protein
MGISSGQGKLYPVLCLLILPLSIRIKMEASILIYLELMVTARF